MFGPIFGFLCLYKLSKVDEFVRTKSTWNLKNIVITTKNEICTINPIALIAVWKVNASVPLIIPKI
jgi:hypothetical protein